MRQLLSYPATYQGVEVPQVGECLGVGGVLQGVVEKGAVILGRCYFLGGEELPEGEGEEEGRGVERGLELVVVLEEEGGKLGMKG